MFIIDQLTEWIKEGMVDAITSQYEGIFESVNSQVSDVATQVGQTPQGWNGGVFSMIQTLSETVVIPIAGMILTFVLVYELIQMILEKNNMHEFDTFNIFKWIFKTFVAAYLLTNCFTIVMAVFDLAQNVISQGATVITGNLDVDTNMDNLRSLLEDMGVWELIGLWLETNIIHLCMWILSIVIFVIVYGRMIEIYLTVSLAPIPFSTMANREWGQMGQNYLRSLFALGFQGFLILVCVAIYAVLVQTIPSSDNIHAAVWGTAGYIHIQSINQTEAIKNVKRKMSDLQKMTIEEQKKAVRAGYDMDIIPSDLATYGKDAENLLTDLQSRNERMFLVTVLVENIATKKSKLKNDIFSSAGIAQKYNCALKTLDYQQEQGFMSSLALGVNQVEINRGLTTSSTAIFVPFTTCELFQEGEALYYGLNAISNNLIMANRKTLKNPNGLFLGTPGSGKSFSAKREIVNVFLLTKDDIIIADPENEYGALVKQFGRQGQVIDISMNSNNYINPMDINLDYSDDENPVSLKSDFILSLCELMAGSKDGLSPIEKTVIDRCTRLVYRDYLQDPRPENMPILGDLYSLLMKQPEPEAQRIATSMEMYLTGR